MQNCAEVEEFPWAACVSAGMQCSSQTLAAEYWTNLLWRNLREIAPKGLVEFVWQSTWHFVLQERQANAKLLLCDVSFTKTEKLISQSPPMLVRMKGRLYAARV